MPYVHEQVPAELFLSHQDVNVYHVYKDDDFSQGPRTYWYTTEEYGNPETGEDPQFDVRELPTWHNQNCLDPEAIKKAISEAIEQGLITQEGVKS